MLTAGPQIPELFGVWQNYVLAITTFLAFFFTYYLWITGRVKKCIIATKDIFIELNKLRKEHKKFKEF